MARWTCNHKKMKTMNTGAILNILAERGPMSRIGLTRALELDGTTVTHLVRELLTANLIEPKGFEKKAMGRPTQLLQLKADGRQAVGLQLEPHKISGALVNLQGQIKAYEMITVEPKDSRKVLLRKMRTVGHRLIKNSVKSRLMGIGLAYPGIVDKQSGLVINSAWLPVWEGVNIYSFMKETFDIPFDVDDSCRCKAKAEHRFGVTKDIDNFVLMDLGVGIGCTVVTDGRILSGNTNAGGELGHNIVVTNGKLCRCGMKGCLETVASIPAIENAFMEDRPGHDRITFEKLAQMAAQKNRRAISSITTAGKYIGIAASSLVNVLNPEYLVISGDLLIAGENLITSIQKSLEQHTIDALYKAVKIVPSQTGKHGALIGAATLILSRVFDSEL